MADYYADPVARRLAVEKVGRHGYSHGWVFHGIPGSTEHATAIDSLANSVANASPGAERALRAAADAVRVRNYAGATSHLANARANGRAEGLDHGSLTAITSAGRGLAGLHSNPRMSVHTPATPIAPPHVGPLAKPQREPEDFWAHGVRPGDPSNLNATAREWGGWAAAPDFGSVTGNPGWNSQVSSQLRNPRGTKHEHPRYSDPVVERLTSRSRSDDDDSA